MADQTDTRWVLNINANSSITSGLAALLFDILLLMVIKAQAQSLCATANLYLIYDKRLPISPTTSSLGAFTGGPVGPRSLSRLLSVLISVSTACVIVLGFSINGKTVSTYETISYKSVIQVTGKALDINYDKEFKVLQPAPGEKSDKPNIVISRWLVAIADSYLCLENNYTDARIYGYAFKDDNLQGDMVPVKSQIDGAECIKRPYFKEDMLSRRYGLGPPGAPVDCKVESVTPLFEDGGSQGSATFTMGSCEFGVEEMFCFRTYRTICASMGKAVFSNYTNAYVLVLPDLSNLDDLRIVHVPEPHNKEDERKIAMNAAFFFAIEIGGDQVSNHANMAITSIFHDRELERETGDREISEVDLGLAVPVVVFVGATTLILLATAFGFWLRVVYSKGRTSYNTFSTLPEVLQLANQKRKEKLRRPWRMLPVIGIEKYSPRLIVTSPERKDDCIGSMWPESEVDGEIWVDEVGDISATYAPKTYEVANKASGYSYQGA